MGILNSVYVKFKNPKFNYHTSVSVTAKFESLKAYFVGQTFFMGSDDSQESDPKMWQTCISIEHTLNVFEVIAGPFKGEFGVISGYMNGIYLLKTGVNTRVSVTGNQLKLKE